MNPEMQAAVDAFNRTLAAFQTKCDDEFKALKKGKDDVITRAELVKINAAIDATKAEVNQLFKKANRPTLTGTAAEQIIETKAVREFARWIDTTDETKAATARKSYNAAYTKMVRRGVESLDDLERKALSVGSAPDGGFWVEPARADRIITRVFETSDMRSLASVMEIGTSSIRFPLDRDETDVEWTGETQQRNEGKTAQVGDLEIPVHDMASKVRVTQNMLDDAVINVEEWINAKTSDKMGRGENTAFVVGSGPKRPEGFLTLPTSASVDATRAFRILQHIATGANGGFAATMPADKLLELIYAFKAPFRKNLRWAMNRTTLGMIRKFKDGQGNYIMAPRMDKEAGLIETIWNYGVSEFADMPDIAANSLSVALGDFKAGYQIVDRSGIRQLRDPYTQTPRIVYTTTKRVGGMVIDSDAIKVLKFAA
jgi:HK97 family phage major capsid protein